MDLNQRFLIVGGDSQIGAALAKRLTGQGETVYITTRRASLRDGVLHLDLTTLDREPASLAALAGLPVQGKLTVFMTAAMTA